MIRLVNALLSAPAACVMSGLSSSSHCVGITYPFGNSSNSQSYLCIERTLGRQFPSETLSPFQPLCSLPLAEQSHPGRLDVTAPITGESDTSPMLWKHGCLFFPPPDWHWSWLMFSCIWAVINFGLFSQTDRQMGFVVHAGLLKSKYTLGHTCSHC